MKKYVHQNEYKRTPKESILALLSWAAVGCLVISLFMAFLVYVPGKVIGWIIISLLMLVISTLVGGFIMIVIVPGVRNWVKTKYQ